MASSELIHTERGNEIGAAAAFAAAERRRAVLFDAKAAWLIAFDAFKAEEARLGRGAEVRERRVRAGGADRDVGAHG